MEKSTNTDKITISQNTLTVQGVTNVASMYEKEVTFFCGEQKLIVSGVGLEANKLELEQGLLEIGFSALLSIKWSSKGGKIKLSNFFK